MIIDDYGNDLYESAYERFIASKKLTPPFWIPFDDYQNQTEYSFLVSPLSVWVPKRQIVKTEREKLFLKESYVRFICANYDSMEYSERQNARVILEHLNQKYQNNKGGVPASAALP